MNEVIRCIESVAIDSKAVDVARVLVTQIFVRTSTIITHEQIFNSLIVASLRVGSAIPVNLSPVFVSGYINNLTQIFVDGAAYLCIQY